MFRHVHRIWKPHKLGVQIAVSKKGRAYGNYTSNFIAKFCWVAHNVVHQKSDNMIIMKDDTCTKQM